jgi:opacity protein-like surface antigen
MRMHVRGPGIHNKKGKIPMRNYLLAGAAALVIAAPAAATNDNSGYVGLEGGILFPKSQSVSGEVVFTGPGLNNFSQTTIGNYRYKKGLDLDFVGGYDFGMFRVEGELGYKHSKPNNFNPNEAFVTAINTGAGTVFTTTSNFGVNSAASVYSAMVNGLIDFGGNGGIGGYAGGGVGYANVHQFGSSHGGFAWQLIAGAYMPVSSNIDIGLKYRYFRTRSTNSSQTFAFAAAAPTCGAVACSGGTATFFNDSRFSSSSLLASLIYNFGGVAAPPPPPPPPPPPAKTYIVFFDFDKSDLTAEAQSTVTEAVSAAKTLGSVRIMVTGHTDTVGSDRYNQALSIRRATSVKDEMVRQGLGADAIAIEGKSFHDPLVPTGPGVREPKNRRAVIDLGG